MPNNNSRKPDNGKIKSI